MTSPIEHNQIGLAKKQKTNKTNKSDIRTLLLLLSFSHWTFYGVLSIQNGKKSHIGVGHTNDVIFRTKI